MAEERNVQQRQHNGHGEMTGAIAEQASTAAEQMGRAVQQGMGRANAALNAVTERSGQAAQRTGEVLGNFRSAIETSARSQPTTTVMLAAFAGFIFGAFWRLGK
ncbi:MULTISPECIES: hypothetical protein [Methylocystis]|uniref:CsbD family protein n=1 Tax=Methylocystis iwaonis TaxID=2885079 RepID=A0ABM8E5E9_9HYPH|nr:MULTISPECIES: hypothetical protein [Methylocystis]MBL1258526.1 hypothetical protein [Methylocystis sp. Sn-Cys]MDJ0449328.1 hypothetical protein [Methylocystis sp. JR02]BDV33131.1 hypothetical protein SS37A_06600 [Methylocystis iwaonis]